VGVARRPGHHSPDQGVARLVDEHRHRGFQETDLHLQRLPRDQTGEGTDRGVEPGDDVGDGHADLRRLRRTGDRHQPTACLGHHVVAGPVTVGPVAARAPDRDPHARSLVPQGFQAEGTEVARQEVLDHDVGALGQPGNHGAPGDGGQVERQRPSVAVDGEEVGRVVTVERWAPVPGVVPAPGPLHLHDIRTEVGEHHAAVGPGQDP